MEADPKQPEEEQQSEEGADPSEEVADTTADLHFEGKGLDPEIEERYSDD